MVSAPMQVAGRLPEDMLSRAEFGGAETAAERGWGTQVGRCPMVVMGWAEPRLCTGPSEEGRVRSEMHVGRERSGNPDNADISCV